MGALERLDLITTAFSEAAVDPTRWHGATEVVAQATGAVGAFLFPIEGMLPDVPRSRSLEAAFHRYIREGWIERDVRHRSGPTIVRRGLATDFDFTTPDKIAREPYYQELLAPHGLQWFVGVKVTSGDDLWVLAIQRSMAQEPFSATEQRILALLSTQLSASAALAGALGFARADAALSAFEVSGSAVVLLDRLGKVIRSNEAASRLLGPDLNITNGRLVSASHDATATLDKALHNLLWRPSSAALAAPVQLPRRTGAKPILAYPLRLSGVSTDALAPCQAVVVLVDLECRRRLPENTLRIIFGLTPAEAKLAGHVISGESVEQIAGRLGIAYETARNQLKSVLAKTKTHRQTELMSMLTQVLTPRCEPR
jgi:DNA-binding CsgD family transcriptional regulator